MSQSAMRLSTILKRAAAPGTTVELRGLSEGRAIADQYRYLEYLDTAEILDNGLIAPAGVLQRIRDQVLQNQPEHGSVAAHDG